MGNNRGRNEKRGKSKMIEETIENISPFRFDGERFCYAYQKKGSDACENCPYREG